MKRILLIAAAAGALLFSCAKEKVRAVNPNATPEAVKLLHFLYEIQGKYTLSGQHNFIAVGSKYTDLVRDRTGRSPIVWGSDFSFCYEGNEPIRFQHCGPLNLEDPGNITSPEAMQSRKVAVTGLTPHEARMNLVDTVIRKYREGFIITLMWHACPPDFGDCCDGNKIWIDENGPPPLDWDALTTEGTALNNAWKAQADTIALYLRQLKEAGVPVLWRPYHEMNGVWFWWGNRKGGNGFRKLWIMLYDYFVRRYRLDNLVWVWNANAPRDTPGDEAYAFRDFWPGQDYVDVLAVDVSLGDWNRSHYEALMELAGGKPVAIGEAPQPPDLSVLESQPRWSWFMPWGNLVFWGNGMEVFGELFASGKVLAKEDVAFEDGAYTVKNRDGR
jgi:mannan endo-1,4-beta-mannosidase